MMIEGTKILRILSIIHTPPINLTMRALLMLVVGSSASALTLSSTFASSMVLQRDQPLTLWGTAPAGAAITVTLGCAGCPAPTATADASGAWRAAVPPLPATRAPFSVTVASPGAPSLVLDDVLVGDVLLCSGQSNMAGFSQHSLYGPGSVASASSSVCG